MSKFFFIILNLIIISCDKRKFLIVDTISFIMTLTISIGLLYLFVNLQIATKQNEINILEISDTTDLIMLIFTLAIAGICAWNSFNANTFFQKAKSKELCVYLSSGMNIVTLSKYLLVQNFILLIISTILGGILGIIFNPIVNLLIMILTSTSLPLFNITIYGTLTWIAILIFEFIFMVMSNVGYAYRTELKYLLDNSHRLDIGDTRMFKAKDPLYYVFFILGAIMLLMDIVSTIKNFLLSQDMMIRFNMMKKNLLIFYWILKCTCYRFLFLYWF
jgi:hypothetical protein